MKKSFALVLLFSFTCAIVKAQGSTFENCAAGKIKSMKAAKITVADPAEDEYDMKYVKLNINLTNTSTHISGDATTMANVVAALMPAYVFELNSQLTIDSVLFNGQSMPVTSNGTVRTIILPAPLSQNSLFTAQVFYHGQPVNANNSLGIRNEQSPSWGNDVTYTMSEPYGSKDWWPTKQSLTDKIDSANIWITVPSNLKAGSNGVLKNITVMPNNKSRYEWQTKYPTDYYLISASVASYVEYNYYAQLTNDSVLVQNYVYDNPQTLPTFKNQIDSVGDMIHYFSDLYGTYPFILEKYGHCMVPLNGGMEHQTMTSLGNFGTILTVHELGHQWFGDNVTCGSWKDIWLNEGFAAYTEYLYVDHFRGPTQAYNFMLSKHNNVLQFPNGSVYVNDTTNESRIFDSRLTYDKGASVIHTLRFVFNNDSLFFAALRNYQNTYKSVTATTSDFKNITQQALGQNLDTFFNQWIYGEGHPIYHATWNQVGTQVIVKLDQTTSDVSVPLFHTPIEFQLFSAQGDTVVRVYNNQPSQIFSFTWDQSVSSLFLDLSDWLLNEVSTITKDPGLSIGQSSGTQLKIFPNPTNDAWHVTGIKTNTNFQLTDINGKLVWSGNAQNNISIPAAHLAAGIYLLKINDRITTTTLKLIRK